MTKEPNGGQCRDRLKASASFIVGGLIVKAKRRPADELFELSKEFIHQGVVFKKNKLPLPREYRNAIELFPTGVAAWDAPVVRLGQDA